MGTRLRINDGYTSQTSEYLSFDLVDILDVLREIGPVHIWSILDFEMMLKPNSTFNLHKMEAVMDSSPKGYLISWNNLLLLSRSTVQVINGIFVGVKDESSIPAVSSFYEKYEQVDIGIEAFDSSYWDVYLKDERLAERFFQRFNKVEILKGSKWGE